ncbi:TlpA disulfide reductase family protein [Pedobacter deserti]|uniref:TlpA disulfide reductase family protein n=1 Tax=Pedobacter deserti TaxID=2817382 RepID=UPI00210C49A0|nr:TlpA disulfide reductase family protein [Pedobacter sp. SYSU D00382]
MLKHFKKWQLLLPMIVLWLPLSNYAQTNEKRFVIQGDMTALPADSIPKVIYFTFKPYLNKETDSVKVIAGRYTISGTLPIPAHVKISRKVQGAVIASIIAAPGTQQVITLPAVITRDRASAEKRNLPMITIKDSSIVRGSVSDSLFKNVTDAARKAFLTVPDRAKLGFIGILTKMSELLQAQIITEIKQHPSSPIAPMLVLKVISDYRINRQLADSLLAMLPRDVQPPVAKEMSRLFEISDAAARKNRAERQKVGPAIGTEAPVFSMNDTTGKPVSIREFRGKYVLIDFWASWCAPCRLENPSLVKAYKEFKDKGFEIIGVSLDDAKLKQAWIKAIHDDGLHWTQLSDLQGWKNAAAALYDVKAIPQNFLLDPSGKIIDKGLRGNEVWEALEKVLR